jgi:two-component system, chemotaxis family, chemotaxis protein CheY
MYVHSPARVFPLSCQVWRSPQLTPGRTCSVADLLLHIVPADLPYFPSYSNNPMFPDCVPSVKEWTECQPLDLRVLIVDDSETTRRLLRTIIRSRQWSVCGEAENGLAGVKQYEDLKPDLVIIDLALPDMNGIEVAKRMSSLDRTVPLVLFTVLDVEGLRAAASQAGICQVVSKFQVWDLIKSIETEITQYRWTKQQHLRSVAEPPRSS